MQSQLSFSIILSVRGVRVCLSLSPTRVEQRYRTWCYTPSHPAGIAVGRSVLLIVLAVLSGHATHGRIRLIVIIIGDSAADHQDSRTGILGATATSAVVCLQKPLSTKFDLGQRQR